MKRYYGVDFEKQREKLLKSKTAKQIIDPIIEKADAALGKVYECLKMSEYTLFIETGDRTVYERKYFERRHDCSYISIAYWLTEDEKYIKPLIDGVFRICDEFTWCLPAHVGLNTNPSIEFIKTHIDLFQAETGRLLTDIDVLVGDKLPYYVRERISDEVRKRLIEPLKRRDFGWHMDCTNNWAAVCAGGTGVALLHYGTEAEISHYLPKLYNAMENFLSGFNEDGCCMEGYAYWNYGFGYFVIFARMILDYTNGEVNYFKREKVKKIAAYVQKTRMGKKKIASFSDGGDTFTFSPGLMSYLKEVYPDDIALPDLELATTRGNVYSMKEVLWFDTDYKEDEYKEGTAYFDGAQWFIKRGKKFSFAAKAGHNDEPHNHNDIGSFMIVAEGDDIPLADLGCGVYNAFTFHPDYRYKMIQNSSAGHSVPIINGEFQKEGKEYCGKNVEATDTTFSVDIEGAYEAGIIDKIHREFEVKENSVTVNDKFTYSDKTKSITERFVSWNKPEVCDGFVDLKTAQILFDKEKYTVSFKEDTMRNHANTEDVPVYLVDFEPVNEKETDFSFEIIIK